MGGAGRPYRLGRGGAVDEDAGTALLRFDPGTDRITLAPPPRPMVADRPSYPLCCPMMTRQFARQYTTCADPFSCPDTVIVYDAADDEYGLPIRDGGTSRIVITHCPWCGAPLPVPH